MEKHAPSRKLVLVVEDEQSLGRLIADAISDEAGFTAMLVSDPAEAIEATRHVKPDVMVVDVRLPGMSGFELYDRLRSDPQTTDVPVLFETADGDMLSEFRQRGIATYIKKPFDLNDLVGYVKRLASGEAIPSAAAARVPPPPA